LEKELKDGYIIFWKRNLKTDILYFGKGT